MSTPVHTTVVNTTGIITLDRPKALNSLNHDMVRIIAGALDKWRVDEDVTQVVIQSSGKHFCAGGDVRSAREGILAGKAADVDAFFAEEYELNLAIATYPKPYVALVKGVDMGGGLGVSAHGSHFVVEEGSFASMPEMNIGYITDVGMSWRLQNLSGHPSQGLGTFLALTGYRLTPDDMLATGLATHKAASVDGLAERIAEEGLGVLDSAEFTTQAGDSELAAWFDAVDAVFTGSWEEIRNKLDDHPELKSMTDELTANASPSALVAAAELMQANASENLAGALENERVLGAFMSREPDFAEGVRAVLVDKSHDASFAPEPDPAQYRALLSTPETT